MNNIGNNITNLRKNHTMSQEQLAEIMHVSRQSVSKWERNEASPDIYNLKALADVFGITVDQLISDGPIDKDAVKSEGTVPNGERILTPEETMDREAILSKSTLFRIIAIGMYIATPFMWMALEEIFSLSESILTLIFGLMIASATGLIIYSATIYNKAERLYGKLDKDGCDDDEDERIPHLSSIVYTIATIIFLLIGFLYGLWHPGWLIFIAAWLVIKIIYLVLDLKQRSQSGGIDSNNNL